MNRAGELLVLMGLRGRPAPGGRVVLTRKFVEGVEVFATRWPGRTTVLLEMQSAPVEDLDPVEIDPQANGVFGVETIPDSHNGLVDRLRRADSGVMHANVFQTGMANACRLAGTPLVYVSESTQKTFLQSLAHDVRNPIVRARRTIWAMRHEQHRRVALTQADGLQCNGTPTFDAYRVINRRPMLFFDSRIGAEDLAPEEVLETRLDRLRRGGPIRLVFSGRLIPIKGPVQLIETAAELAAMGLDFEMDICGGGPEEDRVRDAIRRRSLEGRVRLRGVLDFRTELTPFVASEADLFVCCHLQGDPSCTYLETMACGTPIVGYDNEALEGLCRVARTGWTTRMGKPRELAMRIAALASDRAALADAARRSLEFARDHTFDQTMDRRVAHLMECSAGSRKRREAAWI